MLNKGMKIFILLLLALVINSVGALALHGSTAELQPEWSPVAQNVEYTVTICNEGSSDDSIDETRIYQNPDYEDFIADSKDGWFLGAFNPVKKYYPYTAEGSANYINPGECTDFTFSATTPADPADQCDLEWKFETRDVTQTWHAIYDTTSIDSLPPAITKDVIGPQNERDGSCPPGAEGEECWVTQSSTITIHVEDEGVCQPPSGLNFCDINVVLDGVADPDSPGRVYAVDGVIDYKLQWDEDSQHELDIYCEDEAGNSVSDVENFRVDDTSPKSDVNYIDPYFQEGESQWIDTASLIELTAVDPDPTGMSCNIGEVETYYRITRFENNKDWDKCRDTKACQAYDNSDSDLEWTTYDGVPFNGLQESCHLIEFYSVDALGNEESLQQDCFFVDKTSPEVSKDIGEPNQLMDPTCNPEEEVCDFWVSDETEINLSCHDVGDHPSDHVKLHYRTWFDLPAPEGVWSDWVEVQGEGDGAQTTITFGEDSKHKIEYWCEDAVGKHTEHFTETDKVDATEPTITKEVVGPKVGECPPVMGTDDECFITDDTQVIINVADPDPSGMGCAIGGVDCQYEVWWKGSILQEGGFNETGHTFQWKEDSNHTLKIWCQDDLGNEAYDEEVFRVDLEYPITTKTYGEPRYPFDGYADYCAETLDQACYDSCTDDEASCLSECSHWECGFARWITTETPVSLEVWDEKVGNETTFWRNLYIPDPAEGDKICGHLSDECGGDYKCMDYCNPEYYSQFVEADVDFQEYLEPFYKTEESCHVIEYYSVDALGNEEPLNWQCVFVDTSAPEGIKKVSEPSEYIGEGGDDEGVACADNSDCPVDEECNEGYCGVVGDGLDWFVGQQATVTLSCEDAMPHPVDFEELCYKISYDGDERGPVQDYFTEKYCEEFGGEYDAETEYCCAKPKREEKISSYGWDMTYTFNFLEDSVHNVEFFCEDALGNRNEPDIEWFAVDTKVPITEHELIEPVYVKEVCEGEGNDTACQNVTYIDTASRVGLTAIDPEPHPSGVQDTQYRYRVVEDKYCYEPQTCEFGLEPKANTTADMNWTIYDGEPFGIPEESCHILEYYSVDNLENQESEHATCFFVDKTAPIITKNYEGSYYTDGVAEWISVETSVNLSAKDVGDHPSGLASLEYRWQRVADEYCANQTICQDAETDADWQPYEDSFSITEESCHVIEAKATDNVGKIGYHKQCVFVDDTPPIPTKIVDDPKAPMSESNKDLGKAFYPELDINGENICAESEDKCLDITLLTPINLDCTDDVPHPSGERNVCFQVGLDGEDATEAYCAGRNESPGADGFCCVDTVIDDFLFNEETWHKLSYYCIDNVDNKGPIDEEYFKVEGRPFKIALKQKWNLISVPFVLLDESPEAVFGDLENVELVLAYDSENAEWMAWTPDGPQTLDFVRPGWGYWVLMKEDEDLLIGGSLFQPGKLPPSRQLMPGWNLIGYYGTQWQEYDASYDYEHICDASYEGDTYGGNSYCALNSLVDTQEGYPRWSSIWTQINCGLNNTYWSGVNTCGEEFYKGDNTMYAGRGYWLELDVKDIYAPATSCIWNSDFECVYPGMSKQI